LLSAPLSYVKYSSHVFNDDFKKHAYTGEDFFHIWSYDGLLPENIFTVLPDIKTIQLCTRRTTIPEGIFNGLGNLHTLDLSNHTEPFPENVFMLPEGIFNGLGNLLTLNLYNYKGLLTSDGFNELVNLRLLATKNVHLSHADLQTLRARGVMAHIAP